jgi:Uma2 family endonuclease
MAAVPQPTFTPTEYLELERRAEAKSEYVDGQVYAMAGASPVHVFICSNLVRHIGNRLEGSPCRIVSNDLRVRVPDSSLYSYPDGIIVCGKLELDEDQNDTLLNPVVIFEVLSDSTEKWDRGEKFARYRTIPSLKEYILISQSLPRVERFVREDKEWRFAVFEGLDASMAVASVQVEVSLS